MAEERRLFKLVLSIRFPSCKSYPTVSTMISVMMCIKPGMKKVIQPTKKKAIRHVGDLNHLISATMSGVTCCLCFPGKFPDFTFHGGMCSSHIPWLTNAEP